MAVAVSTVSGLPNQPQMLGQMKVKVASIAFDSSYSTGGELLTAATLGFSTVAFVVGNTNTGHDVSYDVASSKLKVHTSGGTEVTNAATLATTVATLFIVGT